MPDPLLATRALLLHDLAARETVGVDVLALLEEVVAGRRWWIEAWEGGADVVAGQLAQDLQERLLDDAGLRWPACPLHDGAHELRVEPDLGPDPEWVCEDAGERVAPLGGL
ncbi:hypothetical protein CLV35_3634 [Motilibacter peucedani]|uniref:Uncharacterized protein n=1 Tax=Motilibacter peucedani TaxID=598650 RepID=A0A420XKZ8_9ACTN|nr:hypothetical protein [Motilibacter peucedani]RKS68507.1 hypothetical protein CLV35_3634 [Motilibacter peucedani]